MSVHVFCPTGWPSSSISSSESSRNHLFLGQHKVRMSSDLGSNLPSSIGLHPLHGNVVEDSYQRYQPLHWLYMHGCVYIITLKILCITREFWYTYIYNYNLAALVLVYVVCRVERECLSHFRERETKRTFSNILSQAKVRTTF